MKILSQLKTSFTIVLLVTLSGHLTSAKPESFQIDEKNISYMVDGVRVTKAAYLAKLKSRSKNDDDEFGIYPDESSKNSLGQTIILSTQRYRNSEGSVCTHTTTDTFKSKSKVVKRVYSIDCLNAGGIVVDPKDYSKYREAMANRKKSIPQNCERITDAQLTNSLKAAQKASVPNESFKDAVQLKITSTDDFSSESKLLISSNKTNGFVYAGPLDAVIKINFGAKHQEDGNFDTLTFYILDPKSRTSCRWLNDSGFEYWKPGSTIRVHLFEEGDFSGENGLFVQHSVGFEKK